MNKSKLFFGFDTSNYTTSLAVADENGQVLLNFKKILSVSEGQRGLRQSDAVFQHTNNMPLAAQSIREFLSGLGEYEIAGVGYSAVPRDVPGSYMPCFLVGQGVALSASSMLGVPSYLFSHQAGHIMAALYSADAQKLIGKEFAAFHVSGGTTDILHITGFENDTFKIEQIGGTLDLNAGQVIDRVGVHMGLSFPAGPEMEKLAAGYSGKIPKYPQTVKALSCNLSGIENKACALYNETKNKSLCAAYTLKAVGDALYKLSENLLEKYPGCPIVYAGGVMSCSLLKEKLSVFSNYFAAPEFSSDNAAGTALLAKYAYDKRKGDEDAK